jgi:hypothetical protein
MSNPCVGFTFQAQNPVPLEGLVSSQDIFSFVVNEAIDLRDRNGDGDFVDQVVTLRSRVIGNVEPDETNNTTALTIDVYDKSDF